MKTRMFQTALISVVFFGIAACTGKNAKTHYVLAEKLWSDGNYKSAVAEFERVIVQDPKGRLGYQALFRSAMTQTLFLADHTDALAKLRKYVDGADLAPETWSAQLLMGEILFAKLGLYEQAIEHYRTMLKLKPTSKEAPELLFRIAKAHGHLWQFEQAIEEYRHLLRSYPGSEQAERADFEIGVSLFTGGEQKFSSDTATGAAGIDVYQKAIEAFQGFLKRHPKSKYGIEARFLIANCLEELDRLEEARTAYEELLPAYPSKNVVQIRLQRLKEREGRKGGK